MSYCFDVVSRVYREKILPHVPDQEVAALFADVLDEMHSANHKLPSADGLFKGDGLNKDPRVTRAAQVLEEAAEKGST